MEDGRVLYYLDIWRDYMKRGGSPQIGYPKTAAGFLSGGMSSVEDWEAEGDWWTAKNVDKAIDDVRKDTPMCGEAIDARMLGSKSMLNPMAIDMYFGLAVTKLAKKLENRGLH